MTNLEDILKKVKDESLTIDEASSIISSASYAEMGFAKLDTNRGTRQGFKEVVFCPGKSDDHLLKIFTTLYNLSGEVLATRATPEQYAYLKTHFSDLSYNPDSRILKIQTKKNDGTGFIAVCSAGTADFSVAEEAAETAEFFGAKVGRFYDIGVSGLHRLLHQMPLIQEATCVIAIAGMEGALASVIGGLVKNPVIAVPTSVGYGANLDGLSALLTMINSCANGVGVVNIDNGYGAGYLATQINRLAVQTFNMPDVLDKDNSKY